MENCNESFILGQHDLDSSTDLKIDDITNISFDKDKLIQLIESTFINFDKLEIKSQTQDKELLDLMFSYHWYSTQVNNLKDLLPIRKPIRKRNEHNTSITSRVSGVSSKVNNSTTRYGAHKVSISIGEDTRLNSLKKNLNPNTKPITIKTIKVINKTNNENNESLSLSAKQSYKLKPRKKIETNTSVKINDSMDKSYKLKPKKKLNSSQSAEVKQFVYSPIKDREIDIIIGDDGMLDLNKVV
jgi:hypothetical protein